MKLHLLEVETSEHYFCFYGCVLTPTGNVETSYNVDEFWGNISTFKEYEVNNLDFEMTFDKVTIVDDNDKEFTWNTIEYSAINECREKIKRCYQRQLMEELIDKQ